MTVIDLTDNPQTPDLPDLVRWLGDAIHRPGASLRDRMMARHTLRWLEAAVESEREHEQRSEVLRGIGGLVAALEGSEVAR